MVGFVQWVIQQAPDEIQRLFAIPGAQWTERDRHEFIEWLLRTMPYLIRVRSEQDAQRAVARRRVYIPVDSTLIHQLADLTKERLEQYRPTADRPFDLQFAEFLEGAFALPFVIGADKLDRLVIVDQRRLDRFISIDADNFDLVLKGIAPRLALHDLPGLTEELEFATLTDFDPALTAERVPALAHVLDTRRQLEALRKRLEKDPSLVHWLDAVFPRTLAGTRPPTGTGDWIECTVFGRRSLARGSKALIQAFAHKPDRRGEAAALAKEFDVRSERLGTKGLGAEVPHGTKLTFTLIAPDLRIRDRKQSLMWRGTTANVSFAVRVPPTAAHGTTVGTVIVSVGEVPIGQLNIAIEIVDKPTATMDESLTQTARRYTQAFVSYATRDRNKVLARVQMLRLQGIKYFQDVLDLEPGQRWARELYRRIDECDLFLLFWSKSARKSKWVMKEARYAFDRQDGNRDAPPAIHPVIIESPAPSPPRYLRHLHFNDRLVYFMKPRQRPRAST